MFLKTDLRLIALLVGRRVYLLYSIELMLIEGGAIVNCAKLSCKKAFHPECARRGQYFLDIRENESNQVNTLHF